MKRVSLFVVAMFVVAMAVVGVSFGAQAQYRARSLDQICPISSLPRFVREVSAPHSSDIARSQRLSLTSVISPAAVSQSMIQRVMCWGAVLYCRLTVMRGEHGVRCRLHRYAGQPSRTHALRGSTLRFPRTSASLCQTLVGV